MCQNEFKIEGKISFLMILQLRHFGTFLGTLLIQYLCYGSKFLSGWKSLVVVILSFVCFSQNSNVINFVSYLSFCLCLCPVSKVVCWFVCLCHVMSKCLYVMYLVKLVKVIMVKIICHMSCHLVKICVCNCHLS